MKINVSWRGGHEGKTKSLQLLIKALTKLRSFIDVDGYAFFFIKTTEDFKHWIISMSM